MVSDSKGVIVNGTWYPDAASVPPHLANVNDTINNNANNNFYQSQYNDGPFFAPLPYNFGMNAPWMMGGGSPNSMMLGGMNPNAMMNPIGNGQSNGMMGPPGQNMMMNNNMNGFPPNMNMMRNPEMMRNSMGRNSGMMPANNSYPGRMMPPGPQLMGPPPDGMANHSPNNSSPHMVMGSNGMMPPNMMQMHMQMMQMMQMQSQMQPPMSPSSAPLDVQGGIIPNNQQMPVQSPISDGTGSVYRQGTFLESDLVKDLHSPSASQQPESDVLPEVLRMLSLSPSGSLRSQSLRSLECDQSIATTAFQGPTPVVSEASYSSLASSEANEAVLCNENMHSQIVAAETNQKQDREKDVDERIKLIREKNAKIDEKRQMILEEQDADEPTSSAPSQERVYRQRGDRQREGGSRYMGGKPMRGGQSRRGGVYMGGKGGGGQRISDGRSGMRKYEGNNDEGDGWRTVEGRSSKHRMGHDQMTRPLHGQNSQGIAQ